MTTTERAVAAAGYAYGLIREAGPAWRYDANHDGTYTLKITMPR